MENLALWFFHVFLFFKIILALELKLRFWKVSSGWHNSFFIFFLQFIFSIATIYGVSQFHMPGRGLYSITRVDLRQVCFVWFICCCLGPSLFYLRWFLKLSFFNDFILILLDYPYFFIAIFLFCQIFLIDICFLIWSLNIRWLIIELFNWV